MATKRGRETEKKTTKQQQVEGTRCSAYLRHGTLHAIGSVVKKTTDVKSRM